MPKKRWVNRLNCEWGSVVSFIHDTYLLFAEACDLPIINRGCAWLICMVKAPVSPWAEIAWNRTDEKTLMVMEWCLVALEDVPLSGLSAGGAREIKSGTFQKLKTWSSTLDVFDPQGISSNISQASKNTAIAQYLDSAIAPRRCVFDSYTF